MIARAAKPLLRECAVLLTALAFIMAGVLAPRQHAEAAALGLMAGDGSFICHPGETADHTGDPAKLPADHHCDQCVACHFTGTPVVAADLQLRQDWRIAALSAASEKPAKAVRAGQPSARGPPLST